MAGENGRQGRAAIMFCCGTSKEFCTGRESQGQGKFHSTPEQVRACMANWLVKHRGYKQRSNREFEAPDDGPILVLNKKVQRALPGKSDTTYMCRGRKMRVRTL